MATATLTFFNDGLAKKKKAMTSSIVTFLCGDVDFWPFFSHNLYFKYLNESCEFVLNIYIPKAFH